MATTTECLEIQRMTTLSNFSRFLRREVRNIPVQFFRHFQTWNVKMIQVAESPPRCRPGASRPFPSLVSALLSHHLDPGVVELPLSGPPYLAGPCPAPQTGFPVRSPRWQCAPVGAGGGVPFPLRATLGQRRLTS